MFKAKLNAPNQIALAVTQKHESVGVFTKHGVKLIRFFIARMI